MNLYRGERTKTGPRITVNGKPLSRRNDVFTGSSFDWSSSEGALPVAFALLASALGEEAAVRHHQKFAGEVVRNWSVLGFVIKDVAIRRWVEEQK